MSEVKDRERQFGRQFFLFSTLALCVVAFAACDSATSTEGQIEEVPAEEDVILSEVAKVPLTAEATRQAALEILASSDRLYPSYDEHLAEVALAVPGYAGHYLEVEEDLHAEQDLHVLYTGHEGPPGRGDAAFRAALQERLAKGAFAGLGEEQVEGMTVHGARFNFVQLFVWRVALRKWVLGLEGVTALSIDEPENRVEIGVEDLAAYREKVLRVIEALGLPEGSFVIEEVSSVRPG